MGHMTVELPTRQCVYGYTGEQVIAIVGPRYDEFEHWMRGSTRMGCTRADCGGATPGPHGGITFERDLRRFLEGASFNDD